MTVFLIGMRANRWWKLGKVLWTASRMPPMLIELSRNPELGLLGYQQWFGRTTMLVSYWRSPQHLMRYAASPDASHRPAWSGFNRQIGNSGDVGIWHETFTIQPGSAEAVYVNMPAFGLGRALGVEPVTRNTNSASRRLARRG
ncbi:DUF4188 domain-containing protein [Enemella dayhoffiae]|nr:DUF4188 domain-containing protein [Enemella dayhoffiae]